MAKTDTQESNAGDQPDDVAKENSKSKQTEKPWWLGKAVLSRRDPNQGYTLENICWRTALSAEEAEKGEVYVGAALRGRLLELEELGFFKVDRDALAKIKDLDPPEVTPPPK